MPEDRYEANGEQFTPTHDNIILCTFAGSAAMYDHVFVVIKRGEYGGYIFKTIAETNRIYNELAAFIDQNALPMALNMKEPSIADKEAYEARAIGELGLDRLPGSTE